jgi:hypothetical protein
MKKGDEIVIVYGAVRRKEFEDVKFPSGSFVKAYAAGNVEDYISTKKCGSMGQMLAYALHALAKKVCPDAEDSRIIRPGSGSF